MTPVFAVKPHVLYQKEWAAALVASSKGNIGACLKQCMSRSLPGAMSITNPP